MKAGQIILVVLVMVICTPMVEAASRKSVLSEVDSLTSTVYNLLSSKDVFRAAAADDQTVKTRVELLLVEKDRIHKKVLKLRASYDDDTYDVLEAAMSKLELSIRYLRSSFSSTWMFDMALDEYRTAIAMIAAFKSGVGIEAAQDSMKMKIRHPLR